MGARGRCPTRRQASRIGVGKTKPYAGKDYGSSAVWLTARSKVHDPGPALLYAPRGARPVELTRTAGFLGAAAKPPAGELGAVAGEERFDRNGAAWVKRMRKRRALAGTGGGAGPGRAICGRDFTLTRNGSERVRLRAVRPLRSPESWLECAASSWRGCGPLAASQCLPRAPVNIHQNAHLLRHHPGWDNSVQTAPGKRCRGYRQPAQRHRQGSGR